MDPIQQFKAWYSQEEERTQVRIPAACCFSTLGTDGYPDARFLALKEILDGEFIITGPMGGRKGQEVAAHPKAALTFWWTTTERQVRVQGDVERVSNALADRYFEGRNSAAQVVSHTFDQGEPIAALSDLEAQFEAAMLTEDAMASNRPATWGGWRIKPIRIEFLAFKANRLHERQLFSRVEDSWTSVYLQP